MAVVMPARKLILHRHTHSILLPFLPNSEIMRPLYNALLLIAGLCFSANTFAQTEEVHAKWTYEARKKKAGEYELIFHLKLDKGWHIWSLDPGGDGYQIVPSFNIADNPNVKVQGPPTEKGHVTKTEMDGVDGVVSYLSGKIDYAVDVTVRNKTVITGKLNYQICNDRLCLPPTDEDFEIEIK